MQKYTLHIRRGTLVNTDPQRRCYNGCHASSRVDWSPWELWFKDYTFETLEKAEETARLFRREDQQIKAVAI